MHYVAIILFTVLHVHLDVSAHIWTFQQHFNRLVHTQISATKIQEGTFKMATRRHVVESARVLMTARNATTVVRIRLVTAKNDHLKLKRARTSLSRKASLG